MLDNFSTEYIKSLTAKQAGKHLENMIKKRENKLALKRESLKDVQKEIGKWNDVQKAVYKSEFYGHSYEAAGGGTPGKPGGRGSMNGDFIVAQNNQDAKQIREMAKQAGEEEGLKIRTLQPRKENGQFDYNASNLKTLSTKTSRGKTMGVVNYDFEAMAKMFKKGNTIILNGKRYTVTVDLTADQLQELMTKYSISAHDFYIDNKYRSRSGYKDWTSGQGIHPLTDDVLIEKKGRWSKAEKDAQELKLVNDLDDKIKVAIQDIPSKVLSQKSRDKFIKGREQNLSGMSYAKLKKHMKETSEKLSKMGPNAKGRASVEFELEATRNLLDSITTNDDWKTRAENVRKSNFRNLNENNPNSYMVTDDEGKKSSLLNVTNAILGDLSNRFSTVKDENGKDGAERYYEAHQNDEGFKEEFPNVDSLRQAFSRVGKGKDGRRANLKDALLSKAIELNTDARGNPLNNNLKDEFKKKTPKQLLNYIVKNADEDDLKTFLEGIYHDPHTHIESKYAMSSADYFKNNKMIKNQAALDKINVYNNKPTNMLDEYSNKNYQNGISEEILKSEKVGKASDILTDKMMQEKYDLTNKDFNDALKELSSEEVAGVIYNINSFHHYFTDIRKEKTRVKPSYIKKLIAIWEKKRKGGK